MIRNIIPLILLLAGCSSAPDPLEERWAWQQGLDVLALVEVWDTDQYVSGEDLFVLNIAVPDSQGSFTLQEQYWLPDSVVVPLGDTSDTAGKVSELAVVTQLRGISRAFNSGDAALFHARRDSLYRSMQPFAGYIRHYPLRHGPYPISKWMQRRVEAMLARRSTTE